MTEKGKWTLSIVLGVVYMMLALTGLTAIYEVSVMLFGWVPRVIRLMIGIGLIVLGTLGAVLCARASIASQDTGGPFSQFPPNFERARKAAEAAANARAA